MDECEVSNYAVQTINAGKIYRQFEKEIPVFRNVNLRVKKGQIYGLLGPSGCGKTSLFRCILGTLKLTTGTVLVFGRPSKLQIHGCQVGYMPQDNCIYENLTIAECLRYYGTILGLSDEIMESRINFYVNILNLPTKDRVNSKLSGGQMRRVSFAIALINRPQLLILDEPLVAADPIVKDCMWRHMMELCRNNGSSILLSTHYIEEARKAHVVAMMHAGTLVIEGSVEELCNNFSCTLLEDVFYKVCAGSREQRFSQLLDDNSQQDDEISVQSEKQECISFPRKELRIRWRSVKAIFTKNFLNLYRFQGAFLFAILLPSIQILLATYAFGSEIGGMDFHIKNEDEGSFGNFYLTHVDQNVFNQEIIDYIPYDVKSSVRNGDSVVSLQIGQNFTESLIKRFQQFPLVNKDILENVQMHFYVDNSNYFISKRVELEIWESFHRFSVDLINITSSSNTESIIEFRDGTIESFKRSASVMFIGGMLLLSSYFSSAAITILSLYQEINEGHLERTRVAGVTMAELLSATALLQGAICILQNIGILAAALPTLINVNKGSLVLLYIFLCLQGVSGMTFGLLLSVLISRIYVHMICASFIIAWAGIASGIFWPLQAMPYFLRCLYTVLPLAIPLSTINRIIHSGWNLCNGQVLLGFTISIVWVFILISVSLGFLLVSKRTSQK